MRWLDRGGSGGAALRSGRGAFVAAVSFVLLVGCGGELLGTPGQGQDPVLVAAGDIAGCDSAGDEATADLIEGRFPNATVLALGDEAYDDGTTVQFAECYDPSWGRFKDRTKPVPGNHEYSSLMPQAEGYYRYFGEAAGDPGEGYYGYDAGGWRVVALNSNCERTGDCGIGSAQVAWLDRQLDEATARGMNVLAYMHHPRFSSGSEHGSATGVAEGGHQQEAIWQALYDGGADLILTAHDHDYERFAPIKPDGSVDRERGIRQLVVGTGGKSLRPMVEGGPHPSSEVFHHRAYGIVRLILRPDRYEWEFVPVDGAGFKDSGTQAVRNGSG